MATAGRVSGLVIQALRHLGKQNIDASMIATLRSRLKQDDKERNFQDALNAEASMALQGSQ